MLQADWTALLPVIGQGLLRCGTVLGALPVAAITRPQQEPETVVESHVSEVKRWLIDEIVQGMNEEQRTAVVYWLLGCSASCLIAVNLKGLTRADKTTIHIMENLPLRYFPPFGHWEEEFDKFNATLAPKTSPGISLSQFKARWFHVYFHKMSDHLLMLSFFGPAIYFWSQGYFPPALQRQMMTAGLLLAAEIPLNLVSKWLMFKEEGTVSRLRIATQMMIPMAAYGIFVYNGLSMLPEPVDNSYLSDVDHLRILAKTLVGLFLSGSFIGNFLTAFAPVRAANSERARRVWQYLDYLSFAVINFTFVIKGSYSLHTEAVRALNHIMLTGYVKLGLGAVSSYVKEPAILKFLRQNCSMALYSYMIWFLHELRPLP